MEKKIHLIIIFLSILGLSSCENGYFINKGNSQSNGVAPLGVPSLTNLSDVFFDPGSNVITNSIQVDSQNNLYVYGSFNGTMSGNSSGNSDLFIAKLNSNMQPIWSIHFRSGLYGIINSANEESAISMIVDGGSIYLAATTKSAFQELNTTQNNDIVAIKLTTEGAVSWVKHYGEATQNSLRVSLGNPLIDFSQNDEPGHIAKRGQFLFLSFNSMGALFESNAGAYDFGVFKIRDSDGEILVGKQIGQATLSDWSINQGVSTNGSGNERVGARNIAFDRNFLILPYSTSGSLVETGSGPFNDAGYVIFDENLNLIQLKQLGVESMAQWNLSSSFAGSTSADDQFRAVVVNGPNDYLFYGKTGGAIGESNQNVDYFFVRYQNDQIVSIIQYGQSTLPTASAADEPRQMQKRADGRIFCSGHTRSSMFEALQGVINPVVFEVGENGELINGYQLGAVTAPSIGLNDLRYALVSADNFITKDDQVAVGVNNDPVTNGLNYTSYIWSINP